MKVIEESILATLSYYDIFDYPLTGFELWRYLIMANDLDEEIMISDLFSALDSSEFLVDKISQEFGFYFLSGRKDIVHKRLFRKKLADDKWKYIKKFFIVLSIVPFVRGIFVSGSLAMENSKDDSDIDVIIVAKHGRIWTVRTFMTMLTSLLRVRRHGNKTKDRICLNHYITDKSLNIPFESLYNAESYVHLVNVYKEDSEIFQKFQRENNWLKKYMPNYRFSELGSVRSINKNRVLCFFSRVEEKMLSGFLGDYLENIFSRYESARIKRDVLYRKSGGRITIDDNQLEFHPDSHENFIIPEFNLRMNGLGLTDFSNQKDSGLN